MFWLSVTPEADFSVEQPRPKGEAVAFEASMLFLCGFCVGAF